MSHQNNFHRISVRPFGQGNALPVFTVIFQNKQPVSFAGNLRVR
ncbi:hypothetical protein F385_1622 [Pantoea agglomerans 299R]|nr:hypothetical protein F385_1622 [Pantoea agglomerans 299R]